tara:strand:+ start:76 stop:390 length:315 start_codon:yes stop_codon:yes gene_type:complete
LSWPAAEDFCQDWGGHLVTVDNQADHDVLAGYVWQLGEIWIGYNDRGEERDWEWVGRDSDYENWGAGQPDNWRQREDCACLWTGAGSRWNDAICEQSKAFFCER